MFPTVARLSEPPSQGSPRVDANPYRAKRTWPPDFSKLSDKDQFRLERRYKRRSQLKWARPRWMVATRLAQWGFASSILIYGLFFMKWGNDKEGFEELRSWSKKSADEMLSRPEPSAPQPGSPKRSQGPS